VGINQQWSAFYALLPYIEQDDLYFGTPPMPTNSVKPHLDPGRARSAKNCVVAPAAWYVANTVL
jgi:hypothetical protein